MTKRRYAHLLAPGRIGPIELRNRICMTPMGSNLAEVDGHMGERIVRYYEERARGGVGMVIVGVAAISFPAGACNPNQVAISDDVFLPGLTALTERVHRHGARAAVQLQHAGKVAVRDMVAGRPLWVPSEIPFKAGDLTRDLTAEEMDAFSRDLRRPGARMTQHVMTRSDVATLVEAFASAAERAKRAGFDGVELHAGHGYILSSFLSPASNRRDDEYGGPVENRARFLVEALRATRARIGDEMALWCRIDAKEFRTEGGIRLEDAERTAELAAEAGADAIHVSAYADSSSGVAFTDAPLVHEPCGYVGFAARIKRRLDVPVIAVGRIEPDEADRLVAAGDADFVAMGRKLLADPALPSKLAEGRPDRIRPCIYCYTCVGRIFLNQPNACAVNPETGREAEMAGKPTDRSKRVLIVGGGPAGMEAARVAASRGHDVTLCEKEERLGGTLRFSSLVAPVNGRLAAWLEREVRALPIALVLGQAASADWVAEQGADVVVIAVGAKREALSLPGADRRNVLSGDELRGLVTGDDPAAVARVLGPGPRALLALGRATGLMRELERVRALSRRWMPLGRRVVVLGGGLVGVEIAEFLHERGREVAVLEEGPGFASAMAPPRRWRVLHELREAGVALEAGVVLESIDDAGVHYADSNGESRCLAADSVIVATGTRADRELADAIAGRVPELHVIGDAGELGYIAGAIESGGRVARAL